MADLVVYEQADHIASIRIDRAEKRNALTLDMVRQLSSAFGRYARDASARCLVVSAAGEHFCGGLDLSGGAERMMTEGRAAFIPDDGIDPWGVLTPRVGKPVIVAVRGYCFTAGVELMLASDINIVASDSKFAQLEVTRGLTPFGGATVRFPQAVGWHNAMRWMLTGDTFDAAEALRMGLAQAVVEPGEELDEARRLAQRIAEAAPLAVNATLRTALLAVDHGGEAAMRTLYPEAKSLSSSDDCQLGLRTFRDRQRPRFSGQ